MRGLEYVKHSHCTKWEILSKPSRRFCAVLWLNCQAGGHTQLYFNLDLNAELNGDLHPIIRIACLITRPHCFIFVALSTFLLMRNTPADCFIKILLHFLEQEDANLCLISARKCLVNRFSVIFCASMLVFLNLYRPKTHFWLNKNTMGSHEMYC